MNRRKALKSVLALTAVAPAAALGKPEEVTVKLDRDAAFTMLDKNNDVWQRMFDDLLPKPGTFEWAIQQMRNGHTVKRKFDGLCFSIKDGAVHQRYPAFNEGLITEPISASDILYTDWEVVA